MLTALAQAKEEELLQECIQAHEMLRVGMVGLLCGVDGRESHEAHLPQAHGLIHKFLRYNVLSYNVLDECNQHGEENQHGASRWTSSALQYHLDSCPPVETDASAARY